MADVLIFLLRLSDVLDVDLAFAVRVKLALNEDRFPEVVNPGDAAEDLNPGDTK